MQSAVTQQSDPNFRTDFYYQREIPENLSGLDKISWNYYWSWNYEASGLFRELDSELWERCEQNPRLFLKKIGGLQLWQKANDRDYVAQVDNFVAGFDEYLAEKPRVFGKITAENPVAYFCAEYGVHNSLPIYSGGLGILSGDYLKSASDMNVPLVAVGLLYRFGYFRQKFAHDGWQTENYLDSFDNPLALFPVLNDGGEPILVKVHIRGRDVFARAWLANVGRIKLYLLDTNVPENDDVDRLITGHLYGGDTETRIVQEKVLGIGGVRLLRKLGVTPSVYHLNEGHSAFLTLELAREYLQANPSADFDEAREKTREKCVFTTHTPVAAGNDAFPPEQVAECFDENFISALKISQDELFALGRTKPEDQSELFGMTPLALRMARSANGVSEKHGEVSRELWLAMFPEKSDAADVPITHITNGVHAPTWIAPTFQELFIKHIGADWQDTLKNQTAWQSAIGKIPDAEIFQTHLRLKQLLIAFIRLKTFSKQTGSQETINEHDDTNRLFAPDVLTIGFARRVATYKRWNLLLSDLERLLKIINDADKPVQFVFAGKAHPQDKKAKAILQNLMTLDGNSEWHRRAVFIEDYDQEVARYLVQGVDVWLNVPVRPMEASGTSGQKVAMNGGLNLSVLDGWWIEGYNGENGFSIGEAADADHSDEEKMNREDAESLYSVLENEVIPAFYEQDANGVQTVWIRRMKNALATLTPDFSSDRMLKDYIEKIYLG